MDSRAVLLIFSQKHFDLYYWELKSFLFLSPSHSTAHRSSSSVARLSLVGALFILFTRIVRVFGIASFLPFFPFLLRCLISLSLWFCSVSSVTQCFFSPFVTFMWVSYTGRSLCMHIAHSNTRIMLFYFTPLLNQLYFGLDGRLCILSQLFHWSPDRNSQPTFKHAVSWIVVCAMCKDMNDDAVYHPQNV